MKKETYGFTSKEREKFPNQPDPEKMNVTIKYEDNSEEIFPINKIPFEGPYSFNIFTRGPTPFSYKADSVEDIKKTLSKRFLTLRPDLVKIVIFSDLKNKGARV
tara:strand:- start:9 stop:320 length:312 start_codon:yes stop_codon:yes gene_type:complete